MEGNNRFAGGAPGHCRGSRSSGSKSGQCRTIDPGPPRQGVGQRHRQVRPDLKKIEEQKGWL